MASVSIQRSKRHDVVVWRFRLSSPRSRSQRGSASRRHLKGGVLLGAQSASQTAQGEWPTYHHQFIHLDTEGNLYCSLTRSPKKSVAPNLLFNRWYHAALTYDGAAQHVYIDGELIDVDEAAIHHDEWYLRHTQVGSGCVRDGLSRPPGGYYGWYSFHGVVHDFRMWRGVLPAEQIKRLFTGANSDTHEPYFSLLFDGERSDSVKSIISSSPLERIFISAEEEEDLLIARYS